MVDFSELGEDEAAVDLKNLRAVYESFDRKGSHVGLRDPQKEALPALSARRASRDLVLKMSTGYGKTTVALVYLWSHMMETGRPVVYLCPTVQLIEQVLREAKLLGIEAVVYPGGQSHPPPEGTSGRAIIVCTYDKLFNGESTFDRDDVELVPYAIALDDAHSGIHEVRDSFTIRIEASNHSELYSAVLAILRAPCRDHQAGVWAGIENGDEDAVLETPHWVWAAVLDQVRQLLEARYQDERKSRNKAQKKALLFVWNYLRNDLRWCRCLVSGKAIEILNDIPGVEHARAFFQAERRLFMSATLSDDSALVRELGCDPASALDPIVPPSDAGVGERMVLIPSLVSPGLDREWVMKWCKGLSVRYRVVVLTPSEKAAKKWSEAGAKVAIGDNVTGVVKELKAGTASFVVFAQRYDGIDLPDDACRILVLDGMPTGEGLADDHDRRIVGRPGSAYRRWASRVEQGMGRAVRSPVDYAVVVVTSPDLVHFLAKVDVVELMGEVTQAQLRLSNDLTKLAQSQGRDSAKVVDEMAVQCLTRDAGWKSQYERKVRKKISGVDREPDSAQVKLADVERRAQQAAMANEPHRAAEIISFAIGELRPSDLQQGWLLQRKANYVHDYDPGEALAIQRIAHTKNRHMCTPPSGVSVRRNKAGASAAKAVLAWYNGFDHPNGAIAALAELKSDLSFEVKPQLFERGLMEVAQMFGADGSRPEKLYRRGPDDLWVWPTGSWVIEAKNERQSELPKADGEQLLAAMKWFDESFPENAGTGIPVVAARVAVRSHDAYFPDGTRVLTPTGLDLLIKNLSQFMAALTQQAPLIWRPDQVKQLLVDHKLEAEQFASTYTVRLK